MATIRFDTTLVSIGSWTILHLPKEASAQLPSRGQVMVRGTLNGAALLTALEPDGDGSHWCSIDAGLQKTIGAKAGDHVTVSIEPTKDWPEPVVPPDIQAGLVDDPSTTTLWKAVTPMARWEWIRWINATANPQTRAHRITVSGSKLRAGLRRPCCFNRNMCCVPQVSKSGVLLDPNN